MKRVLPLLILVSALEIYLVVKAGEWLFKDRCVNISEVTITRQYVQDNGIYVIDFIKDGTEHTGHMKPWTYNVVFKKQHQIKYAYADGPWFPLAFFYIFGAVGFAIYFIMRTIDFFVMYRSDYEVGDRFSAWRSILPDYHAELYNSIDSYDLSPITKYWHKFWGY